MLPFAPLPPLPVTLIVSWVDELKVTELTEPLALIVTVTPLTKPVPVMVQLAVPLWPGPGLAAVGDVTVGPALTVKTPVPVPVPPSVLVTVTLRAPVVALAVMVMLALRWLESTNVVELTVMPVPLKETVAPLRKPVPTTEMVLLKP